MILTTESQCDADSLASLRLTQSIFAKCTEKFINLHQRLNISGGSDMFNMPPARKENIHKYTKEVSIRVRGAAWTSKLRNQVFGLVAAENTCRLDIDLDWLLQETERR